jgi:hypothetical protein
LPGRSQISVCDAAANTRDESIPFAAARILFAPVSWKEVAEGKAIEEREFGSSI